MVAGNATATIADLVNAAPHDSTVVVFGSAVLNYLDPEARRSFESVMCGLPRHWISNKGGVVQSVVENVPRPLAETRGQFVVTLDGSPLAYAGGHGQTLDWIGE